MKINWKSCKLNHLAKYCLSYVLPVGVLTLGCLVTTSCTFLGVNDVKFVSADVVYYREPSNHSTSGEVKWDGNGPKPLQLLKIQISTKKNLEAFAESQEFHVGVDVQYCQLQAGRKVLLGGNYIYWAGDNVTSYRNSFPRYAQLSEELAKGRPTTYQTFIGLREAEVTEGSPLYYSPAFDLVNAPEDICLFVRGGNMLGFGFHSNTIVIPKAAIMQAMSNAGLQNAAPAVQSR